MKRSCFLTMCPSIKSVALQPANLCDLPGNWIHQIDPNPAAGRREAIEEIAYRVVIIKCEGAGAIGYACEVPSVIVKILGLVSICETRDEESKPQLNTESVEHSIKS